jgi:glycosyltransferase involved in cell wall biosynthesis
MQNLKVSVIIPVYNREHLVERSIRSVLNQTYNDLEVIVIDDASTDGSVEKVKQIPDNRIKLIRNEINSGPSKSRNKGIEISSGGLIAFQDSDDEWHPDKLQKQVDLLLKSGDETGAAYCGMEFIDFKTGEKIGTSIDYTDFRNNFTHGNTFRSPANVTMLVKRKVIDEVGKFDEELYAYEDTELAIRISRKYSFVLAAEALVKVTRNHDQLMGNTYNYIKASEIIYNKHKDYLSRKILFGLCKQIANYYILTNNYKKAKKYIKYSLGYPPINLSGIAQYLKTLFQLSLIIMLPGALANLYHKKYKGEIPLLSGLK